MENEGKTIANKKKNLQKSSVLLFGCLFCFCSPCVFKVGPALPGCVCVCSYLLVFFRFWLVAWLVGLLGLSHVGMQRAKAPVSGQWYRQAKSCHVVIICSFGIGDGSALQSTHISTDMHDKQILHWSSMWHGTQLPSKSTSDTQA